jgi:hypothetical protein
MSPLDATIIRNTTMVKMTVATLGLLALLVGGAVAAPLPNDVGTAWMGGGVYHNPAIGNQHQAVPNR